ncbi:hypothetical protein ANCCAN_21175 [Ancylostoma caninum]|uniref:Uncharacterized protein n=1 Tax=Ancylostoma caninum TaxID=29170 RepID=A0A368FS10_ANCCA|nr:hypothetical protein ANCCAN_21175 [Ancylostoma caninum]
MVDLARTVSGRPLSQEAEDLLKTYSYDLLDALIDATCNETKARKSHKIIESDALKSVKTVSLFPARVVPRATLRIFDTSRRRNDETPASAPQATAQATSTQTPSQPSARPRRTLVDEAQFLEDIRKMRPVEIQEPRQFTSHKLTLDPKDIRPRVGAAAAAEVASAMERPARHFIGRPQPLITEDRGNVQPELTTYHRYRNYLGIVGPMPNIKPNVAAMMKMPAFLQALQQRNEILGLAGGTTAPAQIPGPPPVRQQVQAPPPPVQAYYPQPQAPPRNVFQLPPSFPVPLNVRQAIQRLDPHQATRLLHELIQRQRRQKWVDELERSALMSPTPPLTECDYPLCNGGDHYHCVTSRKSADLTLSLTVRSDEVAPGTPPCTREETPPEEDEWEAPEGPVDHLDCAEYYEMMNPKPKQKEKDTERKTTGKAPAQAQGQGKAQDIGPECRNEDEQIMARTTPRPPPYFTPKEAEKFDRCVKRLQLIANMEHHG